MHYKAKRNKVEAYVPGHNLFFLNNIYTNRIVTKVEGKYFDLF